MVDMADIFDDEPEKKPVPSEKVPEGAAAFRAQAKVVAGIHDHAMAKQREYEALRAEKIALIDEELAHLQAEADEALAVLEKAAAELQAKMEKDGVYTITMPDREPVKIKVIPGRRKPLSKKLLTEIYGKPRAAEIWEETEKKGPDKTSLVIPDPFEDEPDN